MLARNPGPICAARAAHRGPNIKTVGGFPFGVRNLGNLGLGLHSQKCGPGPITFSQRRRAASTKSRTVTITGDGISRSAGPQLLIPPPSYLIPRAACCAEPPPPSALFGCSLAVDLSPVAHRQSKHDQPVVLNLAHDAEIADPVAP